MLDEIILVISVSTEAMGINYGLSQIEKTNLMDEK